MIERSGLKRLGLPESIALGLALFLFVYALSFRVLPSALYTARVISIVALLVGLVIAVRHRGRVGMNSDLALVMLLYFVYAAWTCFRTAVFGFEDISLLNNSILLLVQVFPAALLLGYWIARRSLTVADLMLLLHVVITVQAAFVALTFLSWDFRHLVLDLLHEVDSNIDALHPFRVRGLTHNSGAKLSAFQAVGLLLSAYLLMAKPSRAVLLYVVAAVPVILTSILLTGRVGFLMLPLAFVFVTVYLLVSGRISRNLVWSAVLLPLGVVVGFYALKYLYLSTGGWASAWGGGDAFEGVVSWVVKEFAKYLTEGSLEVGTVGFLMEYHWFFPESDAVFLFGDPRTWALDRIPSDVGVVRLIFGSGLVGATLIYLAGIVMCAVMVKNAPAFRERLLFLTLFTWMIIVDLKEPYFIELRYLSMMALITGAVVMSRRRPYRAASAAPSRSEETAGIQGTLEPRPS